MGKPHFNGRSENSSHQRNESTNLRTISKEQKFTHGSNNLKVLRVLNRNAFDIYKEIQTLEQVAVVEKPAVIFDNPFSTQQIRLISSVADFELWMPILKSHCDEYGIVGFDCEWLPTKKRRPVALLQLATHRGLCLLIRLCFLKMVPDELKEFLKDDKIVKVGVVPEADAKLLKEDYGVETRGTFDLRHMAKLVGCEPRSLKIMSEKYLKIKMSQKNWRSFYKWENHKLDKSLIDYAAMDVHIAIELFKFFANKLQAMNELESQKTYVQSVIDNYCTVYRDKSFVYASPGSTKSQIEIISHVDECRSWLKIFKLHCNEFRVIGFHCNVALIDGKFFTEIQIATFNGLCLVIQLDNLQFIPIELKNVLENSNIVKVGVNLRKQAQFLIQIYGIFVGSILDLCEMDKTTEYSLANLQKMCKADLKVKFNENTNLAFVLIELFKVFAGKLLPKEPFEDRKVYIERVIREHCFKYVDMSYG